MSGFTGYVGDARAASQPEAFAAKEEHDAKVRKIESGPSYGIKPSRADLIVMLSRRLFATREAYCNMSAMAVNGDRDVAMRQQIACDLAQAEFFQAEQDLARAKQPV